MEESWVISLQKQCKAASVPFFFKQWGGVRKKVTVELCADARMTAFQASKESDLTHFRSALARP